MKGAHILTPSHDRAEGRVKWEILGEGVKWERFGEMGEGVKWERLGRWGRV